MTNRLSWFHLLKVAALADIRLNATSEVTDLELLTAGYTMERFNDTVKKRIRVVRRQWKSSSTRRR